MSLGDQIEQAVWERVKEQIRYQTELLQLTWVTLIGARSGSVGLLLGELTIWKTKGAV